MRSISQRLSHGRKTSLMFTKCWCRVLNQPPKDKRPPRDPSQREKKNSCIQVVLSSSAGSNDLRLAGARRVLFSQGSQSTRTSNGIRSQYGFMLRSSLMGQLCVFNQQRPTVSLATCTACEITWQRSSKHDTKLLQSLPIKM